MQTFKRIIKKVINKAGYEVIAKSMQQPGSDTMEAGLNRLSLKAINPRTIIDVGAAQGTWTNKALKVWPSATFELVEPLSEQKEHLDALKSKHSNINYHLAVAGEAVGEIGLNISEDLDGSGVYGDGTGKIRQVPVITLDEITKQASFPVIIKLDTHGYEVSILKGAMETLKNTEALIIEVYGFHISPTCLIFHELSAYLDQLGFRLIDLVDVMRRPGDKAFWQADAFYLRKDNPAFAINSYE